MLVRPHQYYGMISAKVEVHIATDLFEEILKKCKNAAEVQLAKRNNLRKRYEQPEIKRKEIWS